RRHRNAYTLCLLSQFGQFGRHAGGCRLPVFQDTVSDDAFRGGKLWIATGEGDVSITGFNTGCLRHRLQYLHPSRPDILHRPERVDVPPVWRLHVELVTHPKVADALERCAKGGAMGSQCEVTDFTGHLGFRIVADSELAIVENGWQAHPFADGADVVGAEPGNIECREPVAAPRGACHHWFPVVDLAGRPGGGN